MRHRTPQTNYTCAGCYAKIGAHPYRWPISETLWKPLCAGCWRTCLEVEQGLHVAVASTICQEHSYELDAPPAVIRERRKVEGGVE